MLNATIRRKEKEGIPILEVASGARQEGISAREANLSPWDQVRSRIADAAGIVRAFNPCTNSNQDTVPEVLAPEPHACPISPDVIRARLRGDSCSSQFLKARRSVGNVTLTSGDVGPKFDANSSTDRPNWGRMFVSQSRERLWARIAGDPVVNSPRKLDVETISPSQEKERAANTSFLTPDSPMAGQVRAITSDVLKSIDTIYSSGVAKPVGTLFGPSVEKLQSTLQHVSLKELVDGLQKLARARQADKSRGPVYPNKKKLTSVQDFFLYAEAEGRRLFDELDFDADGQVTLEDLDHAMRRRRLPRRYARELLRRVRRHWLAKSFGWPEFQALMEQKEPSMLRAFTSLDLSSSGTLRKEQVIASLRRAGLPATEENAKAMLKFLSADADGDGAHVTYGQFRNFMLLLPPERISDADPSMVWFEAATMVPMGPPIAASAGASVLKSALAGGLASGLSTCIMHPLDTIKTRVQASSATLSEVVATVPRLGVEGLYRGATPAIVGQFASHGLRTGVFEATRMLLKGLLPGLSDYQIQPVASFCSTVLGTAVRIPCEVLKQRLQAGVQTSLGAALSSTLRQEGPRGLFRGTSATLMREVPFYVFGMLIYLQVKQVARRALSRELAPWETLVLGGLSGGVAAVAITPFDVIKTRMMIAPPGGPTGIAEVGMSIAAREGVGALYKGALPRFFWIAPLGAMNFAGYELAKQAIEEGSSAPKEL